MYDEENGHDRAPHLHWEMRGIIPMDTETALKHLNRKYTLWYVLSAVVMCTTMAGVAHDWPWIVQVGLIFGTWFCIFNMRDNYAEMHAVKLGQKQGWEVIGKRKKRA